MLLPPWLDALHQTRYLTTALACIAALDGVPTEQAVAFVREHYDAHAVETPWQRRYVARFLTA